MKIRSLKRKNTKKKNILIGCLIIFLIAVPVIYVYAFSGNLFGWKVSYGSGNKSGVDYGPASTEQKKAGDQTKSGLNSDTPPAPTTIPGSTKKNVQVAITAANQSGSILQIRAIISATEDTGICRLTLTSPGKKSVTKTANTQALANTSTCQGFDVPMSEISAGIWNINIEYSSSTLTGTTTKDVAIK